MLSDVRHVARSLLHARTFTIAALLTFGLGLGANFAVFAVVDRFLFRSLPFDHPDRLITVHSEDVSTGQVYFMLPRSVAVGARSSVSAIEDLAYAGASRSYYLDGPENSPIRLTDASFNALDVLGVAPVAGRKFTREDAVSKLRLVLLRQETWTSRFGGATDVLGRRFMVSGRQLEVAGILPIGLPIPSVNWAAPSDGLILVDDLLEAASPREGVPGFFARLRPGATVRSAQAQLDSLLAAERVGVDEGGHTRAAVQSMQEGMYWNYRGPLKVLFVAGTLVWLIACVNLGNLMVARGRWRDQQLAVRVSLGASTRRLLWPALVESVLLCAIGAGVALGSFSWTMSGVEHVAPNPMQPLIVTSIDGRILAFAILSTAVGSILAAMYPAWRARGANAQELLRDTGSNAKGLRRRSRTLLIVESGIGTVLVLAAALAIRSFVALIGTDLGYSPDGLYILTITVPPGSTADANLQAAAILQTLRGSPEVAAATGVDTALGGGEAASVVTSEDGRQFVRRRILDAYFEVVGTPVVAGRSFTEAEINSAVPVAMVSVSAARSIWPGVPLEQIVGGPIRLRGDVPRQVVGIVGDTRERQASSVQPELFTPAKSVERLPVFLVRAIQSRALGAASLRAAIHRDFGPAVVVGFFPVSDQLEPWIRDPRLYAALFGAFGTIAIVLAAVGLFAVTSSDVALRRQELGVRVALGASSGQIQKMVVAEALRPVAIGVLMGWVVAFSTARVFQPLLHGVSSRDISTYLYVAAVLLATGLFAAWHPAWRAGKADSTLLLRAE